MDTFLTVLVVGITLGGIYALVSIGLNLIFGVIRVVNFAHGELIMLGMYGAWLATTAIGVGAYTAALFVIPAMFAFGVLIQLFVIQRLIDEHVMQIFATFGLLIFLQNVVLATTRGVARNVQGPRTVLDFGIATVSVERLIVLIAATLIVVGLMMFLRRTMLGRAMRAVTQDRDAARLMGINVEWVYMFTFGLGAALAGLGGVLLAPMYTLTPTIGFSFVFAAFAVVILGGLGSVPGAYIGGFVIGLVEAFAGFYIDPALKHAAWFLVFVAVLVVRPQGLMGQVGAEEVGTR